LLDLFKGQKSASSGNRPPPGWSFASSPKDRTSEKRSAPSVFDISRPVTQAELDRILDKISVSGINSLSEDETNALRRAREQMKDRK